VWCPFDENHTVCRLVTSWASTEEEVDELEHLLRSIEKTTQNG
jgi:threonine aldolase